MRRAALIAATAAVFLGAAALTHYIAVHIHDGEDDYHRDGD